MRVRRTGMVSSAPDWLIQSGALLALLGFLFSATTPVASLSMMAGSVGTIGGFLGTYICHSPESAASGDRDDLPTAGGHICCMVCQIAQMAAASLAPSSVAVVAPSRRGIRLVLAKGDARIEPLTTSAWARAPPCGV